MSDQELGAKRERRPDRAALAIAAGFVVLAAIIAWDASHIGTAAGYARIGPQTVPYTIALCLLGLGAWMALEAWRGKFPERETQRLGPVLWIVGGLVVQILLVKTLGFAIATGLLFAATARGMGRVNPVIAVVAGIVLSFLVWLVFSKVLMLSLPSGPIERLLIPGTL